MRRLTRGAALALLLASFPVTPALGRELGSDGRAVRSLRGWSEVEGPTAGLRLAYEVPFGKFSAGEEDPWLIDLYSGVPGAQLELGWQFASGLHLGGYAQYGLPDLQGTCDPGGIGGCESWNWRAGASVSYRVPPSTHWQPWVGGGLGFEQIYASATLPQGKLGIDYSGPAFNLDMGFDYLFANGALAIGPFATLECGFFTNGTYSLGDAWVQSISEVGPHFWFILGIRLEGRVLLGPTS